MKNFIIILTTIFLGFELKSNEPFVILEYSDQNLNDGISKKNINDALNYIFHSNEKTVLITGSLYLVGQVRKKFIS